MTPPTISTTPVPPSRPHAGPERRVRTVYVTRNSEYHVRQGVCVAVRDRVTGQFLLRHPALARPIAVSIRLDPAHRPHLTGAPPRTGDALLFTREGEDLLTSNLLSISRPDQSALAQYPS